MVLRRYFGKRLRNFFGDRSGNVAPIFAIAMLPVFGFVGAAVDYSRAGLARTSMQSALDATALFLSREAKGLTPEQVSAKGQEYFDSIFHSSYAKNVRLNTSFEQNGGDLTVKISARADVDTTIARVLGYDTMPISTSSEAKWGMRRLELALVLDNTTSMASQNRMVELKKATKSLLSTLQNAGMKPDDVKVAIIPYGTEVNIGTGQVNASWLDWGDGQDLTRPLSGTWPYWQHTTSLGRWKDVPPIFKTWIESSAANRRLWDLTYPGRDQNYPVKDCPFTSGTHGFGCTLGPASASNSSTISTIPAEYDSQQNRKDHAGLICPSRDSGSRWTSSRELEQAGVLSDRYYNGCWNSKRREVEPEQWYRIRVRSGSTNPSCGRGNQSSVCTCYGSGTNQFCALDPNVSTWPSGAQGNETTCPSFVNNPSNTRVVADQDCKFDRDGRARLRPYDHFWRPAENLQIPIVERQTQINLRATPTPSARWTGCVRDRDTNYDVNDTTPTSAAATKFQPVQAGNCEGSSSLASITPLTNDWLALDSKVDSMNTGNAGGTSIRYTNITIGLAWGWHALFNNDPMGQAEEPKEDLDKVIILMTDGDNTQNRWNRFNTNNGAIDDRTSLACGNFKDLSKSLPGGIKLYTVRTMEGNETLLRNCATKADMYYNVETASQLNAVFSSIAKNLASLRIAK